MKTHIAKDIRNGWYATTELELGDKRVLRISTSKRGGGELSTFVSIHFREFNMLKHRLYQDYSKCLAKERVRCTSKAVESQHNDVLAKLDAIKDDVERFYSGQPPLMA